MKVCPLCHKRFKNIKLHFSGLLWKPKGKNRKLRDDKIGIEHRKFYWENIDKINK